MRILSVDDSTENLYLIEAMAHTRGYEVVSVHNGVEALEALDTQLFDLIVSDILMPEMDGFQLCHEVKSRERTRHIPFVIYTATYTAEQDRKLALSLGASRFIVKPMEPEQFLATIEEVFSETKRGTSPVPEVELKDPVDYLKAYNARLVHKLDRKIEQLEGSRRELQALLEARDREIAHRKRAEAEQARLEAQFLQSQKLESIGRLAGGVAHDFNNLLTVINGYSDLYLRKLMEDDPLRSGLQEIRNAGEQAAKLTRQLLAFSRRQMIHPKPLNISQTVSEIRGMIQRLVGADVEVVTRLAPSVGPVLADEGQLHQVLLNLVVNAKDAMPGGGRLTIETERVNSGGHDTEGWGELPPGPYVLLTVADTGTGMDPETLQHIFEPFFTTKAEGQGTGLGLSTVYGIVRHSGGWILVDSEAGRGSTFRVYLPEVEAVERPVEGAAPPATALRGTETILVVEDYGSVRSLMVGILKGHGYKVLEAPAGGAALLLAESHPGPIDLVLTDIQMPRMSGPDLVERLRQKRPNLRVLYVSGYLEGAAAGAVLEGPGIDCIAKPFAPAALAGKVRGLLGEASDSAKGSGPSR